MDAADPFARCAVLRGELADLLDTLDDDQLATPSLCGDWDVRTVFAHLTVLPTVARRTFVLEALKHLGSFDRTNDAVSRRLARQPTADLAATLRRVAASRARPPVVGPLAPLADLVLHGADIRMPLGIAFEPDVGDAVRTLGFLAAAPYGFLPKRRLAGLRLAPTDADERWGAGAELTGRAADIALALVGRPPGLDRLGGSGRDVLAGRL